MGHLNQIRIAALVMALGIGLGAIGAHAFKPILEANGHTAEWKTAALYQMVHGLAMLLLAVTGRRPRPTASYVCWLIGVLLFSGSLFLLSYTGSTAKPIVLATPLGGLSFLIGWIVLMIKPQQAFFKE